MVDVILQNFARYFPEISAALSGGVVIFARMLGFIRFAPLLNRTEVPALIKIPFALISTIIIMMVIKPSAPPTQMALVYSILLNVVFGAMMGWIAQCIVAAVEAGGDMINMQMGLQAASILDPTTHNQTSLVGKLFALLGLLVFIQVGGIYWIIQAFIRGFEVFPLYANSFSLAKLINMDYLVHITSNVLFFGLQVAAPVLLATLGQDLILGIVSKTTENKINIFQLSFLFKPVLGAAILIWILPMLMSVINDFFLEYSKIF